MLHSQVVALKEPCNQLVTFETVVSLTVEKFQPGGSLSYLCSSACRRWIALPQIHSWPLRPNAGKLFVQSSNHCIACVFHMFLLLSSIITDFVGMVDVP